MGIIESEYLLNIKLNDMLASAAVCGNSNVDLQKASKSVSRNFDLALSAVPYINRGDTNTGYLDRDRAKAIETWQRIVEEYGDG